MLLPGFSPARRAYSIGKSVFAHAPPWPRSPARRPHLHRPHRWTSHVSVAQPDGLTSICFIFFKDCTSLVSVALSDGAASVGDRAFDSWPVPLGCSIGNAAVGVRSKSLLTAATAAYARLVSGRIGCAHYRPPRPQPTQDSSLAVLAVLGGLAAGRDHVTYCEVLWIASSSLARQQRLSIATR